MNHSKLTHQRQNKLMCGVKIKDSCSLKEWMGFSTEFNKIVSQYGMKGNIKSPVFTPDINKYYWVNYSNSGEMLQSAQAKFEGMRPQKEPESIIQSKIYDCLTLTSRETFAIINK